MIISLSGKPGSGKSTVAKKLARDLGFERYYIGGLRRKAAKKMGLTLAEFNKKGESDADTDKEFDAIVEELGKTKDNFIIESRTAFLLIPHSIKIFLDITEAEGAKRIWQSLQTPDGRSRNEAKNLKTYEDVLRSVYERLRSDKKRYLKHYQVNVFDKQHYDLFLDTTKLNPDEEYQAVHSFIKQKKAGQ